MSLNKYIKINVLKLAFNYDVIMQVNTNTTHKNYIRRQIISLCYNWNLGDMLKIDNYYLNNEYIKLNKKNECFV